MKKFTIKAISTDIDGIEHSGRVKIEGIRKLRFTVYYKDRKKTDAKDYRPDQMGYLIAEQILKEMVKCSW